MSTTLHVPREIKIISYATGIRWIGWGMAEPLFPILLFSLVGSYGYSGLIDSIGRIVFLLILPVAGSLADKISLKKYLLVGLMVFFLDGFWVLAALTGAAIFALLANFFDGIAVASDVVGRATYNRRYSLKERISSVMGFQSSLVNFGWIIGALISLVIVPYVPMAWIFFGIIPTNLIALYIIVRYLKNDKVHPEQNDDNVIRIRNYFNVWKNVIRWKSNLKIFAGLTLFLNAIAAFGTLLIPIYAFTNGASLRQVIILGIIAMLPEIFSSPLGKLADKFRGSLLPIGLALIGLIIFPLTLTSSYIFVLACILIMKLVIILLNLAIENLVTFNVEASYFGRTSAVFEALKDIGKFLGATGLGFMMDQWDYQSVFLSLAISCLLIAWFVSFQYRKNRFTEPTTA